MGWSVTRHRTVRGSLSGVAVALVLGALAAPAAATTLDGSCSTTGPFRFSPAVGPVQLVPVTSRFRGIGQCAGTLDGQATDGVDATIEFSTIGFGGCGTAAYYRKAPLKITLRPPDAPPKVLRATLGGMAYTGLILTAGVVRGNRGGLGLIDGRIGGGIEGPMACLRNQLAAVSLSLQITVLPGAPLDG